CSASLKSWSSGRTPPTKRSCSKRATRSGRAGATPAPRTPTTHVRTSCTIGMSCLPSTTPLPVVGHCRWTRLLGRKDLWPLPPERRCDQVLVMGWPADLEKLCVDLPTYSAPRDENPGPLQQLHEEFDDVVMRGTDVLSIFA